MIRFDPGALSWSDGPALTRRLNVVLDRLKRTLAYDERTVDVVQDLGADPGGRVSSVEAFRAASAMPPTSSNGGLRILVPPGRYLLDDEVVTGQHRTKWIGAGAWATEIICDGPASTKFMRFELTGSTGATPLFSCGLSGMSFTSTTGLNKVVINLVDCSNFSYDDTEIHHSCSGNASIGWLIQGRELLFGGRMITACDRPLVIGVNPYAVPDAVYSGDFFWFPHCWLITTNTSYGNVEIESGAQWNDLTFCGNQSWNQGSWGLKCVDTTSTSRSNGLRVYGARFEQSESGSWMLDVQHNHGIVGMDVAGLHGPTSTRNGIRLGKVNQARLNADFDGIAGTHSALTLAAGCNDVTLQNYYHGNGTIDTTGYVRNVWHPGSAAAVAYGHISAAVAKMAIPGSSSASAALSLGSGTAPSSPADDDMWSDGTAVYIRLGGVTKQFAFV